MALDITIHILTHEHEAVIREFKSISMLTLWKAQNERSKWICITVCWHLALVHDQSSCSSADKRAALRKRGLPCHRSTSGCWTAGLPGSCTLSTNFIQIHIRPGGRLHHGRSIKALHMLHARTINSRQVSTIRTTMHARGLMQALLRVSWSPNASCGTQSSCAGEMHCRVEVC